MSGYKIALTNIRPLKDAKAVVARIFSEREKHGNEKFERQQKLPRDGAFELQQGELISDLIASEKYL